MKKHIECWNIKAAKTNVNLRKPGMASFPLAVNREEVPSTRDGRREDSHRRVWSRHLACTLRNSPDDPFRTRLHRRLETQALIDFMFCEAFTPAASSQYVLCHSTPSNLRAPPTTQGWNRVGNAQPEPDAANWTRPIPPTQHVRTRPVIQVKKRLSGNKGLQNYRTQQRAILPTISWLAMHPGKNKHETIFLTWFCKTQKHDLADLPHIKTFLNLAKHSKEVHKELATCYDTARNRLTSFFGSRFFLFHRCLASTFAVFRVAPARRGAARWAVAGRLGGGGGERLFEFQIWLVVRNRRLLFALMMYNEREKESSRSRISKLQPAKLFHPVVRPSTRSVLAYVALGHNSLETPVLGLSHVEQTHGLYDDSPNLRCQYPCSNTTFSLKKTSNTWHQQKQKQVLIPKLLFFSWRAIESGWAVFFSLSWAQSSECCFDLVSHIKLRIKLGRKYNTSESQVSFVLCRFQEMIREVQTPNSLLLFLLSRSLELGRRSTDTVGPRGTWGLNEGPLSAGATPSAESFLTKSGEVENSRHRTPIIAKVLDNDKRG